jgi:hypothetical protein
MYRLSFYVPKTHLESVKTALFAIGAGRYRNYEHCSWQTSGTGQFKPLAGSKPFKGTENITENVEEFKVEMVCTDEVIKKAIITLLKAHPYEEVAYECYRIMTIDDFD